MCTKLVDILYKNSLFIAKYIIQPIIKAYMIINNTYNDINTHLLYTPLSLDYEFQMKYVSKNIYSTFNIMNYLIRIVVIKKSENIF